MGEGFRVRVNEKFATRRCSRSSKLRVRANCLPRMVEALSINIVVLWQSVAEAIALELGLLHATRNDKVMT